MEPKLANANDMKTYLNCRKKSLQHFKDNKSGGLTTKDAVQFLLQGTLKRKVCRFCLSITTSLSELDEILEVASLGALYQVTIRDMIASFYPFQVSDDPNFPSKICTKCLDKTISSYLFTQQCERAERALRNYFNDINEKFEKLDPLERVKKRGRRKLNPNFNMLYVDYKKVMSYADPIINIVNIGASLEENEDEMEISELECPRCWLVLPNIESLINHEKIHPKSMWYNCRLCGKSFVKYSQYKNHKKQIHISGKKSDTNITKKEFKCNECGLVSEDVGKHLQHIEKHKFKQVIEHLIERKMNDLCTVCMEKGEKMMELNETLHFHAGYPELTGEKSLATILTATIPEKTSYKYEELYIPKQASIIIIRKRGTNLGCPNTERKAFIQKSHVLSVPLINLKISMKYLKDSTFLFTFSKPSNIFDDFKSVDETYITAVNILKTDSSQELPNQSTKNENKDSIEIYYYKNSGEPATLMLCRICWIFKKAQCEKCIKDEFLTQYRNLDLNYNNAPKIDREDSQIKNCNMCWIFSKLDKCDYCKKIMKDINTLESAADKFQPNELDYESRKRKIADATDTNKPKFKWQCSICFTNNDSRETCFCCDMGDSKNIVKFNFTHNNSGSFKTSNNQEVIKSNIHRNNLVKKDNDSILKDSKYKITDDSIKSNEVNESSLVAVTYDTQMEIENPLVHEHNENEMQAEPVSVEPMDFYCEEESIVNQIKVSQPIFLPQEMEQYFESVANVSLHSQFPSIQFNIGSGSLQDKRRDTKMNTVHDNTGTKICETCLNHALASYIFVNKIKYTRDRLQTCISLMLENLKEVGNSDNYRHIMVEISADTILPLMVKEEPVEDVFQSEDCDIDESKLKVEVLEDEFRIESESSDDDSSKFEDFSIEEENIKRSDNLKNTHYPFSANTNLFFDNPARDATKKYFNKKLVNGYQIKGTNSHNLKNTPVDNICSEFLTFKMKPKPLKRRKPKFTCPFCGKHFISDYFLKKHVLKHINMKINCHLCSKQFKSKFYLFEHIKMVHIANDKSYSVCKICGRSFADLKMLLKHKKTHETKECLLCDKLFSSQKRFDSHLQRHAVKFNMVKKLKVQICSFCEKECSNGNELSLHVNKSHLQIKPYSCDMCEKQFYTEYNLSCHKKVHSSYSKETCEFCKKVFKCRKDLVIHLRKHIGTKPHHCQVCQQSFYSDKGLNSHMRRTHGGRFCCRLCKLIFNNKMDLKTHVNVTHNVI